MTVLFEDFFYIKQRDEIYQHATKFAGQRVVDYDPKVKAQEGLAYRFFSDWDQDNILSHLRHFCTQAEASQATAIVIGAWQGEQSDRGPNDVISCLVEHKERLPDLRALYFGDITQDENEMSWIYQTDLSPLFQNFPNLELLRSRGGEKLSITNPEHSNLRALALETGGMDSSVVRSLGKAKLPNLEYLELWLGTDEYGGTVTVEDLQPILSGSLFPNLRYLGLRNSDIADEIARVIPGSSIVNQIEILDLSLGTLSDTGGQALLKLESSSLKKLELHHHYLSSELTQKLTTLPLQVDVSNPSQMDFDEEDRFVAVGE